MARKTAIVVLLEEVRIPEMYKIQDYIQEKVAVMAGFSHADRSDMKTSLVNIGQLSSHLGPPVRQIRTLMRQRKIPFIKTGHRTCLFDVNKVRAALERFEVKEVGR